MAIVQNGNTVVVLALGYQNASALSEPRRGRNGDCRVLLYSNTRSAELPLSFQCRRLQPFPKTMFATHIRILDICLHKYLLLTIRYPLHAGG